ncbi:MAG: hypothetical protein JO145_15755 [Acidobacteriaceae bacterium]|nr:hypothetical protein [Acidobacteriaceae bacterium]
MPHIRLSSGVYRSTFPRRFRDLDPVVNGVLAQTFPSSLQLLRVEDWAASTCLTSCEWAKTLFLVFPNSKFVASDILLFLVEIENLESGERFIFEPDGHPLQYVNPPFVIRMQPPEHRAVLLNRFLYLRAVRRWLRLADLRTVPASWEDPLSRDPVHRNGYRMRKLPLIHPEALHLAQNDARFLIRRQSVFDTLDDPCHAIRSMNIFNRAYFSEEQLALGARAVISSLLPGGIWIAGRTIREDPAAHEVTIFRKTDSGILDIVERVGPGSEIEPVALAVSRSLVSPSTP